MFDNKKNLDLAIRKNKGARIRDQWLQELEDIIKIKLPQESFVGLEETEVLKSKLDEELRENLEITKVEWPSNAETKMYDFLTSQAKFFNNIVYLFSTVDNMIGAVQVPLHNVLLNTKDIWKLVQQDIKLLDLRMDGWLCLEKKFYSLDNIYIANGIFLLSSKGTLKMGGGETRIEQNAAS